MDDAPRRRPTHCYIGAVEFKRKIGQLNRMPIGSREPRRFDAAGQTIEMGASRLCARIRQFQKCFDQTKDALAPTVRVFTQDEGAGSMMALIVELGRRRRDADD